MIEATCGACGTLARIAETDVPVGAKFVTCASCKSRVPLPQSAAPAGKPPAKSGAIPPAIPRVPPPIPTASKPTADLADLPAPKAKGAPPARAAAAGGVDLPAPKGAARPAAPALDLDELMPADLPAPKGKGIDAGLADLPAPKQRASALGDAPASRTVTSALADLPAPKAKPSALADLPAPKAKPSALADLPAPKGKAPEISDLPAPKGITDLPAPKRGGVASLDLDNLPAPKGKAAGTFDDELDLPMPKPGGGGYTDLPMPKPGANNDLPAPKGFFDDLPQPARKGGGSNIDLPAPKGFFDDLPQPATPKPTVDLPAPKNFFDDLPQPTKAPTPPAGGGGGGFFDDLPQPPKGAPKGAKPAGGGAGLFDDLAQPSGKQGGPDDIAFGNDMELGHGADRALELDMPDGGGAPELDLGLPLGQDAAFSDLDLSTPTAKGGRPIAAPGDPDPEGSPIKIKTPKGGGGKQTPIAISVKKDPNDVKLDLADDPHHGKPGSAAAATKPGQKKKATPEEVAEERARKRKRSRIMLAAVLGVALLGGGGFYLYQKHAAEQARLDEIASQLEIARKALGDANPNHWGKASAAAAEVHDRLDPNNVAALGIGAEAAIAGALDNGINYNARVAHGRTLGQKGVGVGKSSPELERAKAMMAIAANQIDRAIPQLTTLLGANPKNGWLQLYMGWAQLAKGDADAALKAFDQAVALDPATKLPALYGHGQAKLLKADLEGAKTDFATVLQTDPNHIGAQVGLAATLPPQQAPQREADLLGVLARSDLDKKDPRAVVKAWTLAGDVARQSGRYDIARDRYRKAIAITALDLAALTGLAAVELRDGKMQVARDLLQKALSANPNDAEAQLLDATADIIEGKLPDAEGKLAKLAERQPPLPPLQAARMFVAKGRLFEAKGKDEEAIAAYADGAKLAGDLDLTPTMAAVTKLSELAKKAPDEPTAMGYRARAAQLLSALAEKAKEDAEVAMTLGIAYLQAGDAVKAEDFLQRAVSMRDKDPESRLQRAKALSALNRTEEAIASLKEALAIDPKRTDVALELAQIYQKAGRDSEAIAAYEKLLAEPNVEVIVRVNAGRFFATKGAYDKAAAQADPILAVEPDNAGGHYLRGEGQILAHNWNEARKALTRATDLDNSDAQALDALGRAFEGSLKDSGDTNFIEGARFAYDRATKADPKMFHPHLGLGRALNIQKHYDEAIKPLTTASALDKTSSGVMYQMGLAYYGLRMKGAQYKKTGVEWLADALRSKPELTLEEKADANYRLGELYFDLGNKPNEAAAAYAAATANGEELEKQTSKAPEWLNETHYRLGQVYEGLRRYADQKRAYEKFLAGGPKPSQRVEAAKYWLATTGKNF